MRAVATVATVATLFFLGIQADSEWSYAVEISLPHSMHLTDSDGTTYIAQQMHFHWGGGSSGMSGSEHTFDGIRRAIEIHIVHFNKNYNSFENAKDRPDGLAVLAVSVEIQDYGANTYYDPFISELASVQYPGQTTTLRNVNILNMLPRDTRHYYTYQGSLTTPPCTENVKWFVFRESSKISLIQALKIENSVMNHNNETLQNGYRQTKPLNKRVVEANFPSLPGELLTESDSRCTDNACHATLTALSVKVPVPRVPSVTGSLRQKLSKECSDSFTDLIHLFVP
ncbi:carbonic anhydrase 6 [Psammomys obesus]|uniref:carbonic anhydrase 6 n=1 Tax=Psammomys obesus TaxID=48139 RepID=UPI002452AA8B|nr:carbonic anhydrase 6 [Psammomys obesus]